MMVTMLGCCLRCTPSNLFNELQMRIKQLSHHIWSSILLSVGVHLEDMLNQMTVKQCCSKSPNMSLLILLYFYCTFMVHFIILLLPLSYLYHTSITPLSHLYQTSMYFSYFLLVL
jgi:hypothetical protein